jgi:hypothetical protein
MAESSEASILETATPKALFVLWRFASSRRFDLPTRPIGRVESVHNSLRALDPAVDPYPPRTVHELVLAFCCGFFNPVFRFASAPTWVTLASLGCSVVERRLLLILLCREPPVYA